MSVDVMARLLEVTRSITGVLDPDHLLQLILASAVELTGAERGFLILVDPDDPESTLRVSASHEFRPGEFDGEEFKLSKNSILASIRTRLRLDRQDALSEPNRSHSVELYGLRSILVEPMIVNDRLIGVIYLDSKVTSRFHEGHREILPSLVSQAAICVENARLVSEREGALRRQHEEQVRSKEMKAWRDAMAAFVSIASHDLKGPLTVLKNGIFLLNRFQLPDNAREVVADMDSSLQRAIRLVETYLDATALLEERKLDLKREPVLLRPLVEQEVDFALSRLPLGKRDLYPVSLEVPEDLSLSTDRHRLQQVLGNLVDNAIKYSPGGGPVSVRARRQDDQVVVVEVADRGQGIAPENQQRLFERFVRGESRVRGTGLGLWIVRQLLHSLGGTIELESQPGQGSTFRLRLPVDSDPAEPTVG